jgi:hypothetical protein
MFEYFPGNYTWSAAFYLALMAGGQFGQMARGLARLRGGAADAEAWDEAWGELASQDERQAELDLRDGYRRSAGVRYLRAAEYRLSGERQMPPGAAKLDTYKKALTSFVKAIELMPIPLERVEIDSPDGILPGYIIPAHTGKAAPIVIFLFWLRRGQGNAVRLHSGRVRTSRHLMLSRRYAWRRRAASAPQCSVAPGLRGSDRRDRRLLGNAARRRCIAHRDHGHKFGRLLRSSRRGI